MKRDVSRQEQQIEKPTDILRSLACPLTGVIISFCLQSWQANTVPMDTAHTWDMGWDVAMLHWLFSPLNMLEGNHISEGCARNFDFSFIVFTSCRYDRLKKKIKKSQLHFHSPLPRFWSVQCPENQIQQSLCCAAFWQICATVQTTLCHTLHSLVLHNYCYTILEKFFFTELCF